MNEKPWVPNPPPRKATEAETEEIDDMLAEQAKMLCRIRKELREQEAKAREPEKPA